MGTQEMFAQHRVQEVQDHQRVLLKDCGCKPIDKEVEAHGHAMNCNRYVNLNFYFGYFVLKVPAILMGQNKYSEKQHLSYLSMSSSSLFINL